MWAALVTCVCVCVCVCARAAVRGHVGGVGVHGEEEGTLC